VGLFFFVTQIQLKPIKPQHCFQTYLHVILAPFLSFFSGVWIVFYQNINIIAFL